MSTWDKLASLPVEIESYGFEALELVFSEQFTRHTTLITLYGAGEEGVGEDVVYNGEDHFAMREAGPNLPITGSWTIGSLSDHLAELDLFPTRAPERGVDWGDVATEGSRVVRSGAFNTILKAILGMFGGGRRR